MRSVSCFWVEYQCMGQTADILCTDMSWQEGNAKRYQGRKKKNTIACCIFSESESRSVVSNSFQHHGLYSPWNSPGQNTGVDSLSLLQEIFPTQGLNPGLTQCRRILYQLSHREAFQKRNLRCRLVCWSLSRDYFWE